MSRNAWWNRKGMLVLAAVGICAFGAAAVLVIRTQTAPPVVRLRFSFNGETPVLGTEGITVGRRSAVTREDLFGPGEPGGSEAMHGILSLSVGGELDVTHAAGGATIVSAAKVPVRLDLDLPSGAREWRTQEPGQRLVVPY